MFTRLIMKSPLQIRVPTFTFKVRFQGIWALDDQLLFAENAGTVHHVTVIKWLTSVFLLKITYTFHSFSLRIA